MRRRVDRRFGGPGCILLQDISSLVELLELKHVAA
jgi:hypothetical protein